MVARRTAFACFVFFSLTSIVALGDDNAAWDAGLAAFQKGEYSLALSAFKTSLASGQTGPAIHYNIGVCQFQTGQYGKAADTFARISQQYPRMRALADYNRGLVAHKQSRLPAARQYFLSAYRLSEDDEKLRILSSTMLRRIEPDTRRSAAWAGALYVAAGYDDNIVLRDDVGLPTDTSTDSSFLDAFATIGGPVPGLGGVEFDGSAYLISYLDSSEFNQGGLNAGLGYQWTGQDWRARIGANAGYSRFGGDAFDDSRNLDVKLGRELSDYSSLEFRYRYSDISAADPTYAGIDGSQHRLSARYRWKRDGRRFDVSYVSESNDRDDPGVSANRNRFRLSYRYDLNAIWAADFGGDFRISRYGDLTPARTEDRVTLKAAIGRSLQSDWRLMARYQYTRNSSSDDTFSYTRNQVSLGLSKIF